MDCFEGCGCDECHNPKCRREEDEEIEDSEDDDYVLPGYDGDTL